MTDGLRFRSVRHGDEEVLAALEAMVEPTPWTVGDFADVLRNGWFCDVLELDDGSIGAWAVVMPVLDEAELLTIGVRPDLQGRLIYCTTFSCGPSTMVTSALGA